jgi:two-component system, OmpR family, phosphate regulon response regulator PhoB
MADQQRLLVFETDPDVRRFLTRRLAREDFDVIDVAVDSPSELAAKVAADRPDLVLLEVGGPIGAEPLITVREASDVPIIGLLWRDSDHDEVTVLDLGADDCVARPLSVRLLVSRIRAVLRRAAPADTRELRFGSLKIDLAARMVRVSDEPIELAAREFDLLAFLASHPGEAFTREQLLTNVWHSSADWQQRETVTEHIHRLRLRIEEDPSRPRWLVTVRGVGYRFSGSSSVSGPPARDG